MYYVSLALHAFQWGGIIHIIYSICCFPLWKITIIKNIVRLNLYPLKTVIPEHNHISDATWQLFGTDENTQEQTGSAPVCLYTNGVWGSRRSVSEAAVMQSEDIWLIMCPPTPPCGVSLTCAHWLNTEIYIHSQSHRGEEKRKRGEKCENGGWPWSNQPCSIHCNLCTLDDL